MTETQTQPDPVVPWFYTLGRAETASFVVLLGIAMPLKYAAGMPAATAWVGWLHGMLLFVYVLGGAISPIDGIGPADLKIRELCLRLDPRPAHHDRRGLHRCGTLRRAAHPPGDGRGPRVISDAPAD